MLWSQYKYYVIILGGVGGQNWAKVNYVVYGKKVPGQESLLGEHHQNACTHTLGLLKRSFFIKIAQDFFASGQKWILDKLYQIKLHKRCPKIGYNSGCNIK